MKAETFMGALIAALILFISSLVTLFTENPELTFAVVKQATWVSVGGGAAVAFLKDFQALTVRRLLSLKGAAAGMVAMLTAFLIVGCGIQRPDIHGPADAIAVTSADVETAAQTVQELCGNTVSGGPCRPGAAIDTETKERLKERLQGILDIVRKADLALAADEAIDADNHLDRARTLLTILDEELDRFVRETS